MQHSVERTELAPGFTISRVLTGLWQIADMERDGHELDIKAAANAMNSYVKAGFTTFDMADHYGSAEEISGLFLKEFGLVAQLLTKWVPKPGPVTRQDVRTAVQRALDRMLADRLDVLQFHAWNYADPVWLDCLYWLQELKEEGLFRFLGLTNFDTAHLRIVVNSGIKVVSNQVCFSLLDQRARVGMTQLCREHNIKLLAFGTIAGGFLTEKWLEKPEPTQEQLTTWSQNKYKRFIDAAGGWPVFQNLLRVIQAVAEKHNMSMANVACRFILDNPAVGGIIIGARLGESEHIRDNLNLFRFSLDEKDHEDINDALIKLKPIPGDCGDEYRKPPFLTASGDLSHHLKKIPAPFETTGDSSDGIRVLSHTPWEKIAGYCRAIRWGDLVLISGTTATHGEKLVGGRDPAAQLHFIIDKIEGVIQSIGGKLSDVVRTRIYIQNMSDWEILARVHGERFGAIKPVNTMIQAGIIGDEYLVEMEVDAIVKESGKV